MDKIMIIKYIIAGIVGIIIGLILGFVGEFAFLALATLIICLAAYKYYRIKKGEIIEPYGLIEKIRYAAVGTIAAIICCFVIIAQYAVGVFLCVGTALLAAALIRVIRTDVLAMDN